jgi:hypothetical protein
MQISQKSSYLTDKCTYKKVQAKMLWKTYNFGNEHENATRIVSLTQRNTKQLNISNLTKGNEIHEMKHAKKLRNKTKFYFWRNKTKRNETKFRCLFCFAKQAKFRETICLFRFVSCFAKQRKGCEMETLIGNKKPPSWFIQYTVTKPCSI